MILLVARMLGNDRNSSQRQMIDKLDDDITEICKDEGHQMKYKLSKTQAKG